jgi:DNA invertase Pin-like site-specific DNA recombinase
MWEIVMMIFSYTAHNYSQMLGVRVREGIQAKKARNEYRGGRPAKQVDTDRLKALMGGGKLSLRQLADAYNAGGVSKCDRVSYQTIRKAIAAL